MHKVSLKKWGVVLALFVMAATGTVTYLLVFKKEAKNVEEVTSVGSVITTPDENFLNSLDSFASKTSDKQEKAKAYRTLGGSYEQTGQFTKALEAYRNAKSLYAESNFSDEEKKLIDESIAALEHITSINSGESTTQSGGFKEPNE